MSRTVEIKFDGVVKSWSLFRFTKSPVPGSWLDSVQKGLDAVLLDLCDTNYRKLSALASLFGRAWFRCVSVIQERGLPSSLILYRGNDLIPWAALWVTRIPRHGELQCTRRAHAISGPLELDTHECDTCCIITASEPSLIILTGIHGNWNKIHLEASDECGYVFLTLSLVDT